MPARGTSLIVRLGLPLALLLTGCRGNNRELLEAELRTKDGLYREALDDQRKAEAYAEALQRELCDLRSHGPRLPPEVAAFAGGVRRIVLGRGTNGAERDGLPGDELLQVVVEPHDGDDHTIKAPGTLYVLVLQVDAQGLKSPLCTWELGPEELRRTWKEGLLSTGYTLTLPWKALPQTETLRVVARLTVGDGRAFEADKDVKVKLLPGALPRASCPTPTPTPLPEAMPAVPTDPLPTPAPTPTPLPTPRTLPTNVPLVVPTRRFPTGTAQTGLVQIGRPQPIP